MKINQDIISTYILISNFMKINQDIISTYILISNFMKINQDIIVTLVMTGVTGLLLGSHLYPLLAWSALLK
jgi:hypothetical protein